MTTADLLTAALKRIGKLAAGQTMPPEDQADALLRLNALVDGLNTERLAAYVIARTIWTIVSGTQTYTVGTGATVNVARPPSSTDLTINIQDTSISPTLEIPLTLLTDDAYEAIPQKAQTGTYPTDAYYRPTFGSTGFGTIFLWPSPTSATLQGVLYAPTAVAEFALTDTLSLPPGYRRFLETNLALELAPEYDVVPSPELVRQAVESKADMKRANSRVQDLPVDNAVARPYALGNIYTGTP